MKRRRNGGIIAAIVVIVLAFAVLAATSIKQNIKVRQHFNEILKSVQNHDIPGIMRAYQPQDVAPKYLEEIFRYNLVGWDIVKVSGQPWPMDRVKSYRVVSVKLYYHHLPKRLLKPEGRYEIITHPQYGPCAVVPVELQYHYFPDRLDDFDNGWELRPPDYFDQRGRRWLGPFDKPLPIRSAGQATP